MADRLPHHDSTTDADRVPAPTPRRPSEAEVRQAIDDLLKGIKGVTVGLRVKVASYYAPRFAQLATLPVDQRRQAYEELLMNLEAVAQVAGIRASTQMAKSMQRGLEFGLRMVAAFILPVP